MKNENSMSEKPNHSEKAYLRIISAIAEEESSSEEKIKEALREEGLNPDEVLKKWDSNFRKKLSEYRAEKEKLVQNNKNSQPQQRKPKGPRL